MGDILGRMVGIFIAVTLLFLLPLLYFAERQETVEQLYLITETTDFVDTVRTTGRMTQEAYEDFLTKLGELPERYEVKMTGRHQRIELSDQTLFLYNEEFYEKQIEETLRQEGEYCFKEGDFFRVVLVKRSDSLFGGLRSRWIPGFTDTGAVSVYYGGMVCYDGS